VPYSFEETCVEAIWTRGFVVFQTKHNMLNLLPCYILC
jgi:hypothetical protein